MHGQLGDFHADSMCLIKRDKQPIPPPPSKQHLKVTCMLSKAGAIDVGSEEEWGLRMHQP